jgi:pilus assembly protein FimV
MFRKSAVAAALLFISASPDTYALGLGSIDMQSALNQPLAAVIELTSATGTDLSQVKISLASREDHQRAGLSRTRILSDFRFNVETGSNGQPVVRISSHDAIHEPFLEFMLQLEWSNGRLLRQYTVLVDPPVTIPAAPAVPAAPVARAPAPVTYETARPVAARPAVTAPAHSVSTPAAAPAADSYGPIRRNETLWDIAKRLRPDESVSIEQMMLALQRANPHAFMNNNINHMKAGVTLKIPERNDIAAMTRREATAETRRQYAEWKAPREVPQQQQPAEVPAVESTAAETAMAETATEAAIPAEEMPVTTEARLQLTAPEDAAVEGVATAGDPGTTAASPDDTSKLSQQLALVSEEAEANRAQSEELQSRVNELEQQIATMQRLLELKSDELASMQQLAASEPAVTEPAVESEPEVATTEAAATEAVAVAGVDSQTVAEKARGIINRLMDNPMLAGLGALVAMILGGILWVSTRQKNNQGLFDDEMTFDDQLAQTGDIEETGPVPLVADIDEYTEPVPEPAAASHQQNEAAGDPLTEADVYLAYGRIQQAEDVLQAAMQNDPADNAVRHKLLEIYHQAGNATAFDSLASDYHESVSEDDSEWLTIAAMGNELSPGNDLYRAAGSGESEVESVGEFDMDLSGMEDLVEDSGPADNELPESIEFNLDDIGTETVSFEEPEDESEGLLDSADEVTTKLDLARAYIDMGDPDGARSILTEVMEEGSDAQKREADTIISQLA